jgi:hypothetical protein
MAKKKPAKMSNKTGKFTPQQRKIVHQKVEQASNSASKFKKNRVEINDNDSIKKKFIVKFVSTWNYLRKISIKVWGVITVLLGLMGIPLSQVLISNIDLETQQTLDVQNPYKSLFKLTNHNSLKMSNINIVLHIDRIILTNNIKLLMAHLN